MSLDLRSIRNQQRVYVVPLYRREMLGGTGTAKQFEMGKQSTWIKYLHWLADIHNYYASKVMPPRPEITYPQLVGMIKTPAGTEVKEFVKKAVDEDKDNDDETKEREKKSVEYQRDYSYPEYQRSAKSMKRHARPYAYNEPYLRAPRSTDFKSQAEINLMPDAQKFAYEGPFTKSGLHTRTQKAVEYMLDSGDDIEFKHVGAPPGVDLSDKKANESFLALLNRKFNDVQHRFIWLLPTRMRKTGTRKRGLTAADVNPDNSIKNGIKLPKTLKLTPNFTAPGAQGTMLRFMKSIGLKKRPSANYEGWFFAKRRGGDEEEKEDEKEEEEEKEPEVPEQPEEEPEVPAIEAPGPKKPRKHRRDSYIYRDYKRPRIGIKLRPRKRRSEKKKQPEKKSGSEPVVVIPLVPAPEAKKPEEKKKPSKPQPAKPPKKKQRTEEKSGKDEKDETDEKHAHSKLDAVNEMWQAKQKAQRGKLTDEELASWELQKEVARKQDNNPPRDLTPNAFDAVSRRELGQKAGTFSSEMKIEKLANFVKGDPALVNEINDILKTKQDGWQVVLGDAGGGDWYPGIVRIPQNVDLNAQLARIRSTTLADAKARSKQREAERAKMKADYDRRKAEGKLTEAEKYEEQQKEREKEQKEHEEKQRKEREAFLAHEAEMEALHRQYLARIGKQGKTEAEKKWLLQAAKRLDNEEKQTAAQFPHSRGLAYDQHYLADLLRFQRGDFRTPMQIARDRQYNEDEDLNGVAAWLRDEVADFDGDLEAFVKAIGREDLLNDVRFSGVSS